MNLSRLLDNDFYLKYFEVFVKIMTFVLLIRFLFLNYFIFYNSGSPGEITYLHQKIIFFLVQGSFIALVYLTRLFVVLLLLVLVRYYYRIRQLDLDFYFLAVPAALVAFEVFYLFVNSSGVIHIFSPGFYLILRLAKNLSTILAVIWFLARILREDISENRRAMYSFIATCFILFIMANVFSDLADYTSFAAGDRVSGFLSYRLHLVYVTLSVFVLIEIFCRRHMYRIGNLNFFVAVLPFIVFISSLVLKFRAPAVYYELFRRNFYSTTLLPEYLYYFLYGVVLFYILYHFTSRKFTEYISTLIIVISVSFYFDEAINFILVLLFFSLTVFRLQKLRLAAESAA